MCCREGTDKPPKAPKKALATKEDASNRQTKLTESKDSTPPFTKVVKPNTSLGKGRVQMVDLTSDTGESRFTIMEDEQLQQLHHKLVGTKTSLPRLNSNKPRAYSYGTGSTPSLSFLHKSSKEDISSQNGADYGSEFDSEELPSMSQLLGVTKHEKNDLLADAPPENEDADSLAMSDGFDGEENVPLEEEKNASDNHVCKKYGGYIVSDKYGDKGVMVTQDTDHEGSTLLPPGTTSSPHEPLLSNCLKGEAMTAPVATGTTWPNISTRCPTSGKLEDLSSKDLRASKRRKIDKDSNSKMKPILECKEDIPAPKKLAPWDDMTGIDMNLLAEFADIVEFV
jgi:hypothetical protein